MTFVPYKIYIFKKINFLYINTINTIRNTILNKCASLRKQYTFREIYSRREERKRRDGAF